ncbi:MAG: TonB-dependent receptor [Methyloglobulus sp.]|nr:TonB-dependent receptor [Methyloglobulus sp.]
MKDNNIAKRLQRIDRQTYCTIKLIITIVFCWVWAAAPALAQTQQFNIPAQALDNALTELADAAELKLLFQSAVVSNLKSHAVSGNYTPKQALDIMLDGTGLNSRSTGTNAVTIEKQTAKMVNQNVALVGKEQGQGSGSGTTLPKVTVEADSSYDPDYYADPYNKDYVIPNATAGTKTDTPIMETPMNVQVITKQVLKDQQVVRLDQALKNVSGVTTNSSNFTQGNQTILLRGFASTTYFRNGFRIRDSATTRPMANVENIEILKGSAAILYGQVDPGGMVNVITKQPLATPYYALNQQFGSYDFYRTTIDATGPVTKNKDLLYRMNMSYENSGSFRDFVDKEDVFLAPVLKWNISPRTQATFELEYNHQHAGLDQGFLPLQNGKPLNIPRSRNYGEYSPITTETIFGGFNWSHQFNDDWTIKHQFSVNQQNVNQPHSVFPNDVVANRQVNRLLANANKQDNTYSTNLDLIGHFDTFGLKHTLLIGGDYYRLNTKSITDNGNLSQINLFNPVHPGTPFQQPSGFGIYASDNRQDQFGFYIQDQIKLPYDVQLMGGIRYQYLHQNNQDLVAKSSSGKSDDAVTPRVGFLWQPKKWLSLYANYVESFGPNDPFALIYPGTLPPPTSAEQYEGGIKTEFFDGRLRATLAYYDLTKTNVATRDPAPGHQGFSILTGAVRSRGPELDITGEILPGWNIIATYANMDARVAKSNEASDSTTAVGSRFFNVPRNTGSVWSTYEILNGDLQGLKFGGGVTLRDGQIGGYDQPAASLAGYATVDLLAAYSHDIDKAKITVQFNINNLLDKHYYSGLTTNGIGLTGIKSAYADFGEPRTFMGSINVQY